MKASALIYDHRIGNIHLVQVEMAANPRPDQIEEAEAAALKRWHEKVGYEGPEFFSDFSVVGLVTAKGTNVIWVEPASEDRRAA